MCLVLDREALLYLDEERIDLASPSVHRVTVYACCFGFEFYNRCAIAATNEVSLDAVKLLPARPKLGAPLFDHRQISVWAAACFVAQHRERELRLLYRLPVFGYVLAFRSPAWRRRSSSCSASASRSCTELTQLSSSCSTVSPRREARA